MPVSVVTDSTACLPPGLAEDRGIAVVALQVSLGDHARSESELSSAELVSWLAGSGRVVRTSQPAPAALSAAYAAAPGEDVVAIHLAAGLSGTFAAAQAVAGEVTGKRVYVVDSRSTGMGLGFPVLEAARVAATGASADDVVAAAEAARERTRALFYVDTLEHLRRGGRIGTAAAWLGTALSVKPLLHVVDGVIAPLEKVRTSARAVARLVEIAVAESRGEPVDVAVHHLAAPDRASALVAALRDQLPSIGAVYESEVGAVVGAHAGPGMLSVVVHRH